GPVRRRAPLRRDAGGQAARGQRGMGGGRTAGDVPVRSVGMVCPEQDLGDRILRGAPMIEEATPMNGAPVWQGEERLVQVMAGSVTLEGNLSLPEGARGIVLFAHGSGSSRHSSRNRHVAQLLNEGKLATLLIDLLTPEEEAIDLQTAHLRFDIGLLATRLVGATDWLSQLPDTRHLRIGYFGASAGAAAALVAAAERPDVVGA